jgi:hypothetical protein
MAFADGAFDEFGHLPCGLVKSGRCSLLFTLSIIDKVLFEA